MVVPPSEGCIYKDLTVQQLPWTQQSSQILKNIRVIIESNLLTLFLRYLIDAKF